MKTPAQRISVHKEKGINANIFKARNLSIYVFHIKKTEKDTIYLKL